MAAVFDLVIQTAKLGLAVENDPGSMTESGSPTTANRFLPNT